MLRVRLIGALEVELDGAVIDSPASQRPWSLFAFLALAGRPVSRSELASRFWPDVLDQSARASLRSALWALRRQLGASLSVSGDRVELTHPGGVWTDVHEFARLAAQRPADALTLCRGDLLEGVEDEWALLARAEHRERELAVLETLASAADAETAVALTRRQVQRDPLDESATRRLIDRLTAAGDRAAAVRAYRELTERLARELGVAPSAATRALGQSLSESPAPVRPPPAAGPLPLVGRARELAVLYRAWEAGAAGVAILRGPAGIGKTRLAAELRHRAAAMGARTAIGAALDLGGSAPLRPWAELLSELLPQLPAPGPEANWPGELAVLGAALPDHFPAPRSAMPAIAPDLQRTRLFEAVVAALGWAAAQGPTLVVLEDIHAADASSLELAAYAARRLATRPVMFVLTRRDLPRRPQADTLEVALRSGGQLACELDLPPLSRDDAAALARAVSPLAPEDLRRIVQRTDGNALLTVETARAVSHGLTEIAPSLRGAVRSALGSVAGESRTLIDLLAVAARAVDAAELRALDLTDLDEAGRLAFETGLLHSPGDRLGFRHGLLRDAAYEEVPAARRTALHHRWATALMACRRADAPAGAAEVARHLRLAGANAEAVPFLAQAARGARAMGALGPAVAYLEEALGLEPEHAELWLELGEAQAWRHRRAEAEHAFTRAVALTGDDRPLQGARAWLGRARAYHGPLCVPRLVLDSASRALSLLQRCPDASREYQEALGDKAWSEAVAGDVDEADRLIDELESTVASGDDMAAYHVGHARALALMRHGRFAESYGASVAGGEAIERAGRPDLAYGCWANAAGAANAAGDPEQALVLLDRGLQAVRGHGLASLELQLQGCRAFVLSRSGRLSEAQQAIEAQQVIADALSDPELSAVAAHDRGLVALEAGDFAAAARALSDALVARSTISRPRVRLACAEALARDGAVQRASAEVRAMVLEPVAPSDFPAALVPALAHVQGLIAQAQGDLARALTYFDEALAGWTRVRSQAIGPEAMISVLADLGRPVVGLIEPDRELARVHADRAAVAHLQGGSRAVVP